MDKERQWIGVGQVYVEQDEDKEEFLKVVESMEWVELPEVTDAEQFTAEDTFALLQLFDGYKMGSISHLAKGMWGHAIVYGMVSHYNNGKATIYVRSYLGMGTPIMCDFEKKEASDVS